MNKVYGFEGETKKKYSELTYKLFEEVFTARTCLPASPRHAAHQSRARSAPCHPRLRDPSPTVRRLAESKEPDTAQRHEALLRRSRCASLVSLRGKAGS